MYKLKGRLGIFLQQTGGPIYADLATLPGMTKPPALDDRVQYSDILPQPMVPAPSVESIPPPLPDKSTVKLINMVLQQGEPDICYDIAMTGQCNSMFHCETGGYNIQSFGW